MPRQLSNNYHKGSLSTFYDEPENEDTDRAEDQGAGQIVSFRSSPSFHHLEDTGLTSESDNDEDQQDTASTADCDDAGAVQVTQEISSDSDLDRTAPKGKTLCRQLSEQPHAPKWHSEGDDDWTIKATVPYCTARRQMTDPMHNQRRTIAQTMARRQITDPMPILKQSMKGGHQHNGSLSTFYD